jgi:hypothetical protein
MSLNARQMSNGTISLTDASDRHIVLEMRFLGPLLSVAIQDGYTNCPLMTITQDDAEELSRILQRFSSAGILSLRNSSERVVGYAETQREGAQAEGTVRRGRLLFRPFQSQQVEEPVDVNGFSKRFEYFRITEVEGIYLAEVNGSHMQLAIAKGRKRYAGVCYRAQHSDAFAQVWSDIAPMYAVFEENRGEWHHVTWMYRVNTPEEEDTAGHMQFPLKYKIVSPVPMFIRYMKE